MYVLMKFYTEWCGTCQSLDEVLLSFEGLKYLKIEKLDVDKHQALIKYFGINSVPTLILFKDGQELWRQAGLMTKSELNAVLNRFINRC